METLQEIALPAEATMVIDDLARVLDPAVRREIVSMLDQPGLWLVPVSYTHLDVYKRQRPSGHRTPASGIITPTGGPTPNCPGCIRSARSGIWMWGAASGLSLIHICRVLQ